MKYKLSALANKTTLMFSLSEEKVQIQSISKRFKNKLIPQLLINYEFNLKIHHTDRVYHYFDQLIIMNANSEIFRY